MKIKTEIYKKKHFCLFSKFRYNMRCEKTTTAVMATPTHLGDSNPPGRLQPNLGYSKTNLRDFNQTRATPNPPRNDFNSFPGNLLPPLTCTKQPSQIQTIPNDLNRLQCGSRQRERSDDRRLTHPLDPIRQVPSARLP